MNQPSLARDEAYLRIRDLVVSGSIASDEPLSERGLSEDLGLGRTPVREALRSLAQDGLLTIVPMRGTFIRQLSFEDLREIHEMRVALEGMAAFLAAERGPTSALDACAEGLRELAGHADLDVEQAQQLGWAFHDELFRASLNSRLEASYDVLRAQSGLALQKMRKYDPVRTRQAVEEHLAIHAAVAARDAGRAQGLMWDHLSRAFQARLNALGAVGPRPRIS